MTKFNFASFILKVKVVSQGAQTNGLLNGKKLAKSLSEMPNGKVLPGLDDRQIR